MLYLLFVLTFLAGILFYGLSPSDKKLDMTMHQAEGMIISFLAQHQAAKDYLYTWLGAKNDANTGNLTNDYFLKAEEDSGYPTLFNFEQMMPKNISSDMCSGNQGIPGEDCSAGFVSRVVCTNEEGTAVADCDAAGSKHYVITYGGWSGFEADGQPTRPSWWPRQGQDLRRFESWRKAIAQRTRGSFSCGVLFQEDATWCIDNGETVYKNESAATKTCMKKVPAAVIGSMPNEYKNDNNGLDDLLFCISEFKQGRDKYYVTGATYFYDGLDNIGTGQHQKGTIWTNLADSSKNIGTLPINSWENGYYSAGITTNITLGESYILTILAAVPTNSNTALFQTLDLSNNSETIFGHTRLKGTDAFAVTYTEGTAIASICNMILSGYDAGKAEGIISWTFVVRPGEKAGNQKIDVYENTTKHTYLSNREITSTNGKTFVVGSGARIYGIRYYPFVFPNTEEGKKQLWQLLGQNFKVDQKRFGIADINNAKLDDKPCVDEDEVKDNSGG